MDFKEKIKERHEINVSRNEKIMLNQFIANVIKNDPDILIGHLFYNFVLEVILNRMRIHSVYHWAALGRLRRKQFPNGRIMKSGICSGRLICDTFTSTQEFLDGRSNYDLSTLTEDLLYKKYKNIDTSIIPKLWTNTKDILFILDHCQFNSSLVLELLIKIELLPLTLQLTCICGNIWQDSLFSQRALRNEYLLLHEFFKKKYIVPEKYTKREKESFKNMKKFKYDVQQRKKKNYSGGLVFEPIVGLHNQFILLLDFNSLYPSIIQEYNICFSTVPHWKGPLDVCQIKQIFDYYPYEEEIENTILPQTISFLLTERIVSKNLIKDSNNPTIKKKYNIKQLAVKLVANSMYGCLGFDVSRFFCQPIAELITALGRKNLKKASVTALKVQTDVLIVYGDTDSIMVKTQLVASSNFNEFKLNLIKAKKIAHKLFFFCIIKKIKI